MNQLNIILYNIIQILYNGHATSFVYFVHNNKLNFLFFNSGKGIDLHKQYNDKYLPYFGYSIDNTVDNKEKFVKITNAINIYSFINNYKKYLNDNIRIRKFLQCLESLFLNLDDEKINKINKINLKNIRLDKFIIICKKIIILNTTYEENKIKNKKEYDNNMDLCKSELEKTMVKIEYYNFIKEILDIIFEDNIYEIDINIHEEDNFTEKLTNILYPDISKRNKITEDIINKIKFHFYNKNIYINQQESGSCAWFSLYWSILYYFIINIKDNNYFNFIEQILNKCVKIINDNYNKNDNYIKIFEDDIEKYFKFSDLCYKFININLLSNNIIEDNNYSNLLFKSQNLNWNISYDKQLSSNDFEVSSLLDYLKYIGLLIKNIINSDIIFQKLFDLYKYIKVNNISIFKQNSNIVLNFSFFKYKK